MEGPSCFHDHPASTYPAPSDDPFQRPRPGLEHPPPASTDLQSYEIERLLNRKIVKKGRGLAQEYLIL